MSATFENDVVGWIPDAPHNHTQISSNADQHSAQIFDNSTPMNTLRLDLIPVIIKKIYNFTFNL